MNVIKCFIFGRIRSIFDPGTAFLPLRKLLCSVPVLSKKTLFWVSFDLFEVYFRKNDIWRAIMFYGISLCNWILYSVCSRSLGAVDTAFNSNIGFIWSILMVFYYWNEQTVLWIISIHSLNSWSVITNGGANRIISPCVGFASSPLSRRRLQISRASYGSFITIAFNRPKVSNKIIFSRSMALQSNQCDQNYLFLLWV